MAAASDNKLAVVIGNSSYTHADPLEHPVNDAAAMAAKLSRLGFHVTLKKNLNHQEMHDVIDKLASAPRGTILVFYYAGHAMQIEGNNYFLPVDFQPEIRSFSKHADKSLGELVGAQALNMREVLSAMERSRPELKILILDACRDNAFGLDVTGGLAEVDAGPGTLFAYAAMPGGVAYDGGGSNSIYTGSLLKYIDMSCVSLNDMLNMVGKDVFEKTRAIIRKNRLRKTPQQPWVSHSPMTSFSFGGCSNWEAIEDLLNSFSSAFERKDLAALRRVVTLSSRQESHVKQIFESFHDIELKTSHPDIKSPEFATARARIVSLVNVAGNVVFPPTTWGNLNLKIRKVGGQWRDVKLEWGLDHDK